MNPSPFLLLPFLALLAAFACAPRESALPRSTTASPETANRVASRAVLLYFEGPSGLLVPETREIPLPENDAAALHPILAALLGGSANASVPRLLPEDTTLRGVYLLPEGTAVVDLGGATLQDGWNTGSRTEMLAAYGIVQTVVANSRSVRQVHLLIGGEVVPTLGGHLDLSRPLRPAAYLVERGSQTTE